MKKKYSFWYVFYSILVLMLSTNIPSPLYGIYRLKYDFSPLILTLIFATYAVILIPSLVIFGKASDRYGRKKLILLGTFFSIIGSLLFVFSNSIVMLFLARASQGFAVGMLSGAASAALIELNPYKNKHAAALAASIATAGGTAIGPLVGGVIAQYAPYPQITPYLVHFILVLPSLLGFLWVTETVQYIAVTERKKETHIGIPVEIKRPFMLASLTAFLAWAVTALFMSVIPSYISALMHLNNLALSGGVVCLMLSSSVVIQLILQKFKHTASMITGLFILSCGLAIIITAVPSKSIVLLLIGTIAAGVGQGLAFKGSMQLANIIAPADQRAKIVSTLYIFIYLGVGLPIIGVGLLSSWFGLYNAVLYFAFTIGFVSLALIFRVIKSKPELLKANSNPM